MPFIFFHNRVRWSFKWWWYESAFVASNSSRGEMILLAFPHWLHIDCSQALSHSLGCVSRTTGEQLTHVWLFSDENRHVITLFFFASGIGWSQRRYTSFPRLSGSLGSSPPLLTPLNKTVSSDESDDTELFEPVNDQVQFCAPLLPSLSSIPPSCFCLFF